jgi:hypothetical protein
VECWHGENQQSVAGKDAAANSDAARILCFGLLIIESTLCIVLTASKFDQEYKWLGFLCMIGVFATVVAIVTVLTAWKPKNLLYGKEEHSIPQIEPSALRDQIEDIIFERVRPEYLNTGQGSEKQI